VKGPLGISLNYLKVAAMNTRLLTVLVGTGLFGGTVSGSTQNQTASALPRAQFAELVHDFGRISSGDVVRHDFVFTNTGTATLEIKDVRPGCGCTTAGTWDRRVDPGKTGVIPLQLNSSGFNGAISKTAIVLCNDPAQTNVVLQIKGTIWKPIEVTPAMAVFNVLSEGQTNDTRIMRIVNHLDDPIELSDLKSTNQSFQAELKTVQPGREFELHVKAVPPYTSNTAATVSVKTSAPQMPMINVGAYIVVQQPIIVAPAQITLPAGRLAAAMSLSVKFLNKGTNALALSDPVVNSPGTEVRLQELRPGQVFSLMVNFPAGFQTEPDKRVEVSVKSNHPRFPLLKVPVIQQGPVARAAPQIVPAGTSPVSAER
jgi:hypothetical protein